MTAKPTVNKLTHNARTLQPHKKGVHSGKRLGAFQVDLFNAMTDGVILLKPNLTITQLNQHAKTLLINAPHSRLHEHDLSLFRNKKGTLRFDLTDWLNCLQHNTANTLTELLVWRLDPKTLETLPLLLKGQAVMSKNGRVKALLLIIIDRRLHSQMDEQKRLMQVAFNSLNGQFIANEKGYITHPNPSFIAMCGLSAQALNRLTFMQWIEQQVTFVPPFTHTPNLLSVLLTQKHWRGEVEICSPLGAHFYALLSISMLMDEHCNVEHFVVHIQNITDIKTAQQQLQQMALYDELTRLPNRRFATEHIQQSLLQHQKQGTFAALLHLNLERFKTINDAFGRKTGDLLLINTTQTLQEQLTAHDTLTRIGGDEFLIVSQPPANTLLKAQSLALQLGQRICTALNRHFEIQGLTLHNSVRIGISHFPCSDNELPETLLINADLAATRAKQLKSAHKIYVYDPALSAEVKKHRMIEDALSTALLANQFELVYQAQIDRHERLHGVETLVRWNHPTLGSVPPNTFIPIAEESREILNIGLWVLTQALHQACSWAKEHPNLNMSVNISPIQFHEADFVKHINHLVNITGAQPKNLTLELTEGVLISDTESALAKIEALAQLGFKISIDDFGTGYSSLRYLQKLPIHEVKIDKSFIFRIPQSQDDIAIVETIISLARHKKLTIVAEGVENQAQVDFLHQQPVDILMQGYFYSRPCSANAFYKQFLDPDSPPISPK